MKKNRFSREITDHMLWSLRLRSYLQGIETLPEHETSSVSKCELAKWLSRDGLTKFSTIPEVNELHTVHNELHRSINRLVNMKQKGIISEARSELKKIDPMSKKIVTLLAILENKINQ